jgi:hypothetical protein
MLLADKGHAGPRRSLATALLAGTRPRTNRSTLLTPPTPLGDHMNHMRQLLQATVLLLVCAPLTPALGQEVRHDIHFPDLPGFKTLKCDLHMHTVFSDGLVWPTVRVEECWRQGLDVISITDHVEYQPHKDDIPVNHARPYDLAKGAAHAVDMLLIRGTEITRDTPPGHFNALFLENITKLDTPEFLDAIKAANEQGAFVFWNHQAWQQDVSRHGSLQWTDLLSDRPQVVPGEEPDDDWKLGHP